MERRSTRSRTACNAPSCPPEAGTAPSGRCKRFAAGSTNARACPPHPGRRVRRARRRAAPANSTGPGLCGRGAGQRARRPVRQAAELSPLAGQGPVRQRLFRRQRGRPRAIERLGVQRRQGAGGGALLGRRRQPEGQRQEQVGARPGAAVQPRQRRAMADRQHLGTDVLRRQAGTVRAVPAGAHARPGHRQTRPGQAEGVQRRQPGDHAAGRVPGQGPGAGELRHGELLEHERVRVPQCQGRQPCAGSSYPSRAAWA